MNIQTPNSCCKRCLSTTGCFPWGISKKETALHSIPGIGFFTSLTSWTYRNFQAKSSEKEYLILDSEAPPSPSSTTSFWKTNQLIAVQKSNCLALMMINLCVSTTIYGVYAVSTCNA